MNTHQDGRAAREALPCPSCGSTRVRESIETDRFQYGEGEAAVNLSAAVLIKHCDACGLTYTREDAEEARHEAVCQHLGVLCPSEIKAIREKYGASQAEFADVTRIGKASLARWESGALIQSTAYDNFLRLLAIPANYQILREKLRAKHKEQLRNKIVPLKRKFRAISDAEIENLSSKARLFELFPHKLTA